MSRTIAWNRIWIAATAVLLVVVLAACGAATEQAPAATAVAAQPTAVPAIATSEPTQPAAAAPTEGPTAAAAVTPSVSVADQPIVEDRVVIAEVVSSGPGWLVVHAEKDGKPGPALGFSLVKDGINKDVVVSIDSSNATSTLYAMLHSDAGSVGTYEFPGPDGPVMVGDQIVSPAFRITGGLAAAATADPAATALPTMPVETPAATASATQAAGGTPTVAAGEAEVEMEDFQFRPNVLTVRVGTTVKFANKDRAEHTATSDTGVFDSGLLGKGEEFFFTFTEPGEYPYYCRPHGGPGGVGMSGLIIVVP